MLADFKDKLYRRHETLSLKFGLEEASHLIWAFKDVFFFVALRDTFSATDNS